MQLPNPGKRRHARAAAKGYELIEISDWIVGWEVSPINPPDDDQAYGGNCDVLGEEAIEEWREQYAAEHQAAFYIDFGNLARVDFWDLHTPPSPSRAWMLKRLDEDIEDAEDISALSAARTVRD
jgi:hypothetical protein